MVVMMLVPLAARATSNECMGKPDGTQCKTECTTNGVCVNQKCTGGMPKPDGTQCATGDACTIDDTCKAGTCVPGGMRTCAPVFCFMAKCDPMVGCIYIPVCDMFVGDAGMDGGRDGGPVDAALDGAMDAALDAALADWPLFDVADFELPAPDYARPDLRPGPDLGRDLGMGPRDLGMMPPRDLATGPRDLAMMPPSDGAVTDGDEGNLTRIRGSGCDCSLAHPSPPPWLLLLLANSLLTCSLFSKRHRKKRSTS
jgi:hypothetical protein